HSSHLQLISISFCCRKSGSSCGTLYVRLKAFRLSLHCLGQGALEQFNDSVIATFYCNDQGSYTRFADCVGISAAIEQGSSDSDVTATCSKQQRRTTTTSLHIYVRSKIQQSLNGGSVEVDNSEH